MVVYIAKPTAGFDWFLRLRSITSREAVVVFIAKPIVDSHWFIRLCHVTPRGSVVLLAMATVDFETTTNARGVT